MYCQSAQSLIHHAPDAGVRTENRLKTLLLLLQAMGCKKEKWAGTQAGDSAAVQQKRKLGNFETVGPFFTDLKNRKIILNFIFIENF